MRQAIFLIGLIIFALIAYKYKNTKLETTQGNLNKKQVILYYADWCGHCKQFKPEWEKFKKIAKNVTTKEFTCDNNKNGCDKIKGYPTIIILNNGKRIEYEGERTANALVNFIN